MSGQEKGQGKIAIFLTKQNDKNMDCGTPPGFQDGGRGRSAPRMQPALETKGAPVPGPLLGPAGLQQPCAWALSSQLQDLVPRKWGFRQQGGKSRSRREVPRAQGPQETGSPRP